MATVRGRVIEVGTRDALFDPVNANVVILSGKTPVGIGTIDRDDTFSVEIPDDLTGELELTTSIHGAANILFDAGSDAELLVMINRGGSNFLA